MPELAVNIDHVATVRQARLGIEPDPILAAAEAEAAGACGIIAHLREDRRHIQDRDIELLSQNLRTRLHLEMAATEEMRLISLEIKPYIVCLVPEKREELTTEGGLAVKGREKELGNYLRTIHEAGIKSSLFIEASKEQIKAAREIGSEYIEIHTGHYADAVEEGARRKELEKILAGIEYAREIGLKVNLGHGLNYENILAFSSVPGICEYSIGHSIISRSIFVGLNRAVKEMLKIVSGFSA